MRSSRSIELQTLDISDDEIRRLEDELLRQAEMFSLPLERSQARLCLLHLLYVLQVNTYINLTRIDDVDEALTLHILDSLLFSKGVEEGGVKFLDMGTGAGFPGIPFHILTGMPGVLLDSVGKKVAFDSAVISELSLDGLGVVHDRVELYAGNRPSFDVVLARALASLPVLIEYASPFLGSGGQLVISKGNLELDERERGNRAALLCGFELRNSLSFDLPGGCGHREILTYVRVKEASVKLPRPAGTAKRNPLA